MPYLHFETQENYEALSTTVKAILHTGAKNTKKNKRFEGLQRNEETKADDPTQWAAGNSKALYDHLLLGYLTPKAPGKIGALQTRRTLDQYFYTHVDTLGRDKDQVVYRYSKDVMKSQEPMLFMVDQLWLWVINEGAAPKQNVR